MYRKSEASSALHMIAISFSKWPVSDYGAGLSVEISLGQASPHTVLYGASGAFGADQKSGVPCDPPDSNPP